MCTPFNLSYWGFQRFQNATNAIVAGVQRIEGKEYRDIDSAGVMPLAIIVLIPCPRYRALYNCPNYPTLFRVISYQRT